MSKNLKYRDYTIEDYKKEALKYKTKKDFMVGNRTLYNMAYLRGYLDYICSHMIVFVNNYSIDEAIKLINNYKYLKDFVKENNNLYAWVIRNNNQHLIKDLKRIKPTYNTSKANCLQKALLCKNKTEFAKKYLPYYRKALKNNWINDICNHMVKRHGLEKRYIYIISFINNKIYIGLSVNVKRRVEQHKRLSKFKHLFEFRHSIFIALKTDMNNAVKTEQFYIDYYKSLGYDLLNEVRGGSLGGKLRKWTKNKILNKSMSYNNYSDFCKDTKLYKAAIRFKLIKSIKNHFDYNRVKWTKNKILDIAKNYKTLTALYKDHPYLRKKVKYFNLNDTLRQVLDVKTRKRITKEYIIEISKQYDTLEDFKKHKEHIYVKSKKLNLLETLYPCQTLKRKPNNYWAKDKVIDEASKYIYLEDFRKNSGGAYRHAYINKYLSDLGLKRTRNRSKFRISN